jgi:hypothetical protein
MTTEQGRKNGAVEEIDVPCEVAREDRKTAVRQEAKENLLAREAGRAAAKAAYSQARTAAEAVAEQAGKVNDVTLQDLRCKIEREQRRPLSRLWRQLRDEIRAASPPPGCRRPRCNADGSIGRDEALADLAGRVAAMRYEARDLDTYFGTLLAEPTALTERVAAAQSDVEQLVDDVKNADSDTDLMPFYARARVLEWRLSPDELWGGFTIASYLACLNDTMACLRREWRAIAALEGAIAERVCVAESVAAKVAERRSGAIDELLERYGSGDEAVAATATAADVEVVGAAERDDGGDEVGSEDQDQD